MTDDQELRLKALEIAASRSNDVFGPGAVVKLADEFYQFLKNTGAMQMAAEAQKLAAKVREWDGASV